jgi:hypothetical protein
MSWTAIILALAAAQGTPAMEMEEFHLQPNLDWLAGYWLSCESGREVAETWSAGRGGVMMGYTITTGPNSSSWEQMRIEAGAGGELSFVAQPRGADRGAAFRLVRSGPREAVFENMAHDFPQRVIYRREGSRLTGRIEGAGGASMEWRYRSAPLNRRCPRRR